MATTNLYNNREEKLAFIKVGNIITFKDKNLKQLPIQSIEKSNGKIRLIGPFHATKWFKNIDELIGAIDWSWMEYAHSDAPKFENDNITRENYFQATSNIDFSKLSATIAQGHELVKKITQNGTDWDIDNSNYNTLIDNHLKLLNNAMQAKPVKETPAAAPKKAPVMKKTKPVARPVKPIKKTTTARVKAKKPKTKEKVQPAKKTEPKAPVTIKKFSLELQHIKRYLNQEGKKVKVNSLQNLQKAISKALATDAYIHHKTLLAEINSNLISAISKLEKTNQNTVEVGLSKEFKAKCKDIVAAAKVRIRTEFLAGLPKK